MYLGRGVGCLGCLSLGGLVALAPVILVVALIYWLFNRNAPGVSSGTPTPAGGAYCSKCGRRLQPGARFCDGCGTPL